MQPILHVYSLLTSHFLVGQGVTIKRGNLAEAQSNDCTKGEEIIDYEVLPTRNTTEVKTDENDLIAPKNIHIEIFVVVDEALFNAVGKQYVKGIWKKPKGTSSLKYDDKQREVKLYVRKFITAINSRFQNQFSDPKIELHISKIVKGKSKLFTKVNNGLDFTKTLENIKFYAFKMLLARKPI